MKIIFDSISQSKHFLKDNVKSKFYLLRSISEKVWAENTIEVCAAFSIQLKIWCFENQQKLVFRRRTKMDSKVGQVVIYITVPLTWTEDWPFCE